MSEIGRSRTQDILLDQLDELRNLNLKSFENNAPLMATDYLYVSLAGDGSDGQSWSTAFHTINEAVEAASDNLGNLTAVLIGPGAYDVNSTGYLTIQKNMALIGAGRGKTRIQNLGSGIDGVIEFEDLGHLQDLAILPGEFAIGVKFSGSGAVGGSVKSVDFLSPGALKEGYFDGHSVSIYVENCDYIRAYDVRTIGEQGTTDAIRLNAARNCHFEKFETNYSQYNILALSGSKCNHFEDFVSFRGLHGVNFGTGTEHNLCRNFEFINSLCTVNKSNSNVIDLGYQRTNKFEGFVSCPKWQEVAGDITAGTNVSTGAVAGDYGNWISITNGSIAHAIKPLKIRFANPSANATWMFQIGVGSPRRVVASCVISTTAGVSVEEAFDFCPNQVIKSSTNFQIRISNDNAGVDNIDCWLIYEVP